MLRIRSVLAQHHRGDLVVCSTERSGFSMAPKVTKSEDEWRAQLTPEQYTVCRQKGTERAFTGQYWNHHEPGVYRCAACGQELFSSDTKFDSGTGWPSFWASFEKKRIATETDRSFFMRRTEVLCRRC